MAHRIVHVLLAAALLLAPLFASAQTAPTAESEILFQNVRVFDGVNAALSAPTDILVRGNKIASIGTIADKKAATVIDGGGRTLMPGLIDAHTHIMFSSLPRPRC